MKGILLPETKRRKVHKTLSKVTKRQTETGNCNSIAEQGIKHLITTQRLKGIKY